MKRNKNKIKIFYLFIIAFLVLGILILIIQFVTNETLFEYEIGQSPIDKYSIGHFVSGILICSLFLMVLNQYDKKTGLSYKIILSFMFTFIFSIGFEILENSDFIVNYTALKYNNRRDSFTNSYFDIILNTLGASLTCYIYWKLLKNKQKNKKRILKKK